MLGGVEANPRIVSRQLVQSLLPRSGPANLRCLSRLRTPVASVACAALHWYSVCWACMLAYGMYAALCMKGCCLLAYTRMLSALKLLCSVLFGTWVVFVYTRSRLLAACAAFCTTGDVLASCVPTGASHVLLLAYCMYVVLRLHWFHAHAPVSCILGYQIGLVVRGYRASPCSLHTCEYSVGVHRCWMLAQACYVRVSTLGIRLSMTLRGLLRRLGYACCCSL